MTDTFEPDSAEYADRVRASFARQNVMDHLGIELDDVQPGHVRMHMPFSASVTQQHGFVHAGVITTGMDTACGYAAFSLMPADAGVLTVEFKTNLLAPARGDTFVFEGIVIKPGRTLTVCEGRAFASDGDNQRQIATMTATLMSLRDRDDVKQ